MKLRFWMILPIILVVITLISSCYFTHSLPIEVMQYPKSPLPPQTQNIAFVDKTCPPERDSIGFSYILDHRSLYSEFPSDSILSTSFLNGMKSTIDQSGFFSIDTTTIAFDDFVYDSTNKSYHLQTPSEADLLISLDKLTINDVTTFYASPFDGVYGQLFLKMSVTIRLFSIINNTTLKTLHISDSIDWQVLAYTANEAYQELPKRYDVFPEALFWLGENMATSFCPYWVDVDRTIIDNYFNKLLQNGANAAMINNWDRAKYYWNEASKAKNKSVASYAFYNLALYEEIQGNIPAALQNIEKAQALKNNDSNNHYYQILKSEAQKIESLEKLRAE